MTVYKGRANCRNIANILHQALLAEGFQEISSDVATNGRVYKTLGTNGESEFYINLSDPVSNYLNIGIYEKYEPNPVATLPGTFSNGWTGSVVTWNTSYSHDRMEVNYVFNITADRAILFVEGMKEENANINSLTYIGLPKRYADTDKKGHFAGMAYTARGSYNNPNYWRALKNRALVSQSDYIMDFYSTARSFGWGGKLFFSPIFLGRADEGVRGEMDAIYVLDKVNQDIEVRHKDTFQKDGKTYMIIVPTDYGNDTLTPGNDYMIEI